MFKARRRQRQPSRPRQWARGWVAGACEWSRRIPCATRLRASIASAGSFLKSQEAYFVYADNLLSWLNWEGRVRDGKIKINPQGKPTPMKQPDLHIP
jgi:hypothetical protein